MKCLGAIFFKEQGRIFVQLIISKAPSPIFVSSYLSKKELIRMLNQWLWAPLSLYILWGTEDRSKQCRLSQTVSVVTNSVGCHKQCRLSQDPLAPWFLSRSLNWLNGWGRKNISGADYWDGFAQKWGGKKLLRYWER